MLTLEKAINNVIAGDLDYLEDSLLLLSGLNEGELRSYKEKIGLIIDNFWQSDFDKTDDITIAKSLFDYLWFEKKNRFNEAFLLTEVIDNQLSDDKECGVGNCLGLTSLYSILALRLKITSLKLFCGVDHTLNFIKNCYIENTFNGGFDTKKQYPGFKVEGIQLLIASSYNHIGLVKEKQGRLIDAIEYYTNAISISPEFAASYLNRGNANWLLGRFNEALADFNKAIELKKDNARAYNSRGIVKELLHKPRAAMKDFNKALKLAPEYKKAYHNKESVRNMIKHSWFKK